MNAILRLRTKKEVVEYKTNKFENDQFLIHPITGKCQTLKDWLFDYEICEFMTDDIMALVPAEWCTAENKFIIYKETELAD